MYVEEGMIKSKWECGECGDLHDDEYDARDCCRPSVRKVYLCPVCEDTHDTEEDAKDCCPSEEGEPHEYRPSAHELEAAGQQRLF